MHVAMCLALCSDCACLCYGGVAVMLTLCRWLLMCWMRGLMQ